MKMKVFWDRILAAYLAVLIFLGGTALLLGKQSAFSARENRALSRWQSLRAEEVWQGGFIQSLSRICSDQFPLRESLVALRANIERLLGKGEHHGVLWGKDGYLIPRDEYSDISVLKENVAALSTLCDNGAVPAEVWILPRSVDVMNDKLPDLYEQPDLERLMSILGAFSPSYERLTRVLRTRAAEGEQVWYRTDHHFTTAGAYETYRVLVQTLGIDPMPCSYFTEETVSDTFLGSSYSAVGGVAEQADHVILYRYENDDRFQIEVGKTKTVVKGFYDRSKLNNKDQYEIFLGGNHDFVRVTDPTQEEHPRYLLVKDSFANCLIPFLAIHADLDVVDLRYTSLPLSAYTEAEEYDGILVVAGLDTLATDPSFRRVSP
ncbi:MAG: hypothetical protein IJY47_07980 [Clostridia bacterium]|nr:hypothetical protein [Clostridia bacterium]